MLLKPKVWLSSLLLLIESIRNTVLLLCFVGWDILYLVSVPGAEQQWSELHPKVWTPGEGIGYPLQYSSASLVAQLVKNPPAVRETWVWSLGREDPLEEGMATHSSILAWRIPWTEEPGMLYRSQKAGHNWATKHTHKVLSDKDQCISLLGCHNKVPPTGWLKP